MNPRPRRTARPSATGGPGPDLTGWGLGAGAAVIGLGGVLWCGAALACLLTGRPSPTGGALRALRALGRVDDPASAWPNPSELPGPVPYWAGTGAVLALCLVVGLLARRLLNRTRGEATGPDRVRTLPGLATPTEAMAAAGRRSSVRRGAVVRPSTGHRPAPEQVGYRTRTRWPQVCTRFTSMR